jgi:hypothetical protein
MADEIAIKMRLAVDNAGGADSLELLATAFTQTGVRVYHHVVTVTTSESALPTWAATSPTGTLGWAAFKCTAVATAGNYINIKTATSGTAFAKLIDDSCAVFYFGSGVTAPYVQAVTGNCTLEYLILEA